MEKYCRQQGLPERRDIVFVAEALSQVSQSGQELQGIFRLVRKTRTVWLYPTVKKSYDTFSHFDRIPACDRRTDGQTDRHLATEQSALFICVAR